MYWHNELYIWSWTQFRESLAVWSFILNHCSQNHCLVPLGSNLLFTPATSTIWHQWGKSELLSLLLLLFVAPSSSSSSFAVQRSEHVKAYSFFATASRAHWEIVRPRNRENWDIVMENLICHSGLKASSGLTEFPQQKTSGINFIIQISSVSTKSWTLILRVPIYFFQISTHTALCLVFVLEILSGLRKPLTHCDVL